MAPKTPEKASYDALGVSHQKEEIHNALKNVDKGLFPTAFCKIIPDIAEDPEYCSALHTDGVGTKSIIAYLMYKETGDIEYFRGLVHDSVVMNTDDLLCIGATGTFMLTNGIERNKKIISGDIVGLIINEYEHFTEHLREFGLQIFPCGGETGDVGDLVRTISMDSTVMTRLKRDEVITPDNIQPNDVIVGLSSSGKAIYEEDLEYNSGISSNGITLARHGLLKHEYFNQFPECVNPELDESQTYFGQYSLQDPLPGTPLTIGQAILSPTRSYAPILIKILNQCRPDIHAIFHNTGGGQTKCVNFGSGIHYIKDNLFTLPPLFEAIEVSSQTPWEEMYQTFNMGHRMEIICPESIASEFVIPVAKDFDVDAQIIGHIEKSEGSNQNQITIQSPYGTFIYSQKE